DGTPAVLKVLVPRGDLIAQHEVTVLRHAAGEGCALLLRDDVHRNALLLERLGPSMHDLGLPFAQRLPALTAAAQRMWRPAPDLGLPTGAEKGRWLIEAITRLWAALDRPCSERVITHAVGCAERRISAHDDERSVLVHGDVHQWNALESADGFRLIDPDGLLAEAEYDLGILMREDPEELLEGDAAHRAIERAELLASWTDLDATAIWEWGVVERVSTGLLCVQIGLQPVGDAMLQAAALIAGSTG
ncbi:MAG: aminoglycoside phosphotransferase family protein, partial [Ilumatobacteraceae bacterium]